MAGAIDANYGSRRHNGVLAFDRAQITHPENRANPQPDDPALIAFANGSDGPAFDGDAPPVTGRKGDPGIIAFTSKDAAGNHASGHELAPTLRGMGHDESHQNAGGQVAVAFQCQGGNVGPMGTLPSGNGGLTGGVPFVGGVGVRRLTPIECERLMGFPDGWTAVPYRKKPAADGNRYRACGNSMVTTVVRWIGERIELVERLCR